MNMMQPFPKEASHYSIVDADTPVATFVMHGAGIARKLKIDPPVNYKIPDHHQMNQPSTSFTCIRNTIWLV